MQQNVKWAVRRELQGKEALDKRWAGMRWARYTPI